MGVDKQLNATYNKCMGVDKQLNTKNNLKNLVLI